MATELFVWARAAGSGAEGLERRADNPQQTQKALFELARLNSAAREGKYAASLEDSIA